MKNKISQMAVSGHPAVVNSFEDIFDVLLVSFRSYLFYNLADVSF